MEEIGILALIEAKPGKGPKPGKGGKGGKDGGGD